MFKLASFYSLFLSSSSSSSSFFKNNNNYQLVIFIEVTMNFLSEFWSLDVSCSSDVNIVSPPSMHPCKKICDITGYEVCGSLDKMWYYRSNQYEYLVWMFDPAVRGRFISMDICIPLLKFFTSIKSSSIVLVLCFRSMLRVEPTRSYPPTLF